MKATFNDFIDLNKNCSGFKTNADMQELFDFLNEDERIIKMIDSSENGKPALAGCVQEVETWHDAKTNSLVDFNDPFTKTVVGKVVKTILAPFGYLVTKQKDMPTDLKTKYFTSASCYVYDANAPITMKIIKKVVKV